ncbi:MAG: dihydrodipicolinate synthase family protein [Acidiferrobacterales bacterium]|nr:dihydrodipicolinate synthase family protein [Acidiferrobacterales bacterium]
MNTFEAESLSQNGTASTIAAEAVKELQAGRSDLYGVWAPCLTPLDDSCSIDFSKLCDHISWLLSSGCHGVGLFGTTGEASSFSANERMTALERVIESGIAPEKLMIGNGFPSITDTVTVTRHALQLGCKKVLMLPPFYYKDPSLEGVSRSYRNTLDQLKSSDIRVVLYHFPKMSAVPIRHELIEALIESHGELIAGLKDSSGEWDSVERYIRNFPALNIFPGTDVLLLRSLKIGGAGTITATADINPDGIRRIFDLWTDGCNAAEAQIAADRIREIVSRYPLSAALKSVHAELRDDPGWRRVRPPLTELSSSEHTDLLNALTDAGFRLAE